MSAFIVDRAHIDILADLAVHGPRGGAVSPDNAWHGPRWSKNDPRECDSWQDVQWVKPSTAGLRELAQPGEVSATEIATMLLRENIASVGYRYDDTEWPNLPGTVPNDDPETYVWERPAYRLTAVEGLSALDCYEYQACEHPEWRDSQAYRFCDSLRSALIGHLPGYREAGWEWTPERIAEARASAQLTGRSGR